MEVGLIKRGGNPKAIRVQKLQCLRHNVRVFFFLVHDMVSRVDPAASFLLPLSHFKTDKQQKGKEEGTPRFASYHLHLSHLHLSVPQRLFAMKTFTFSVSALLATLVYSSSTVAAEAPATAYFFSHGRPSTSGAVIHNNDPSSNSEVPLLNLKETRATLAHLLNLGQGHDLNRNHDESFIDLRGPIQQVFSQPGMTRKDLFETVGGNLMMVIEGVQQPHG